MPRSRINSKKYTRQSLAMNLILLEPDEPDTEGIVKLQDRRSAHITDILHCKVNDTIRAGIINGPIGIARILAISSPEVILAFSAQGPAPPRPAIDLILALPRPIMLKKIFSQIATLGIGRLFLINANRVEKSFFTASLLDEKNYRPYLLQGLEQARDTMVPEVSIHKRFRPFVEDYLSGITDQYSACLVAHPETEKNLPEALAERLNGRLLLAVGPEGGWVDFEIDKFKEQGFTSFNMGPRILRVETAVVALLAQLDLLRLQKTTAAE